VSDCRVHAGGCSLAGSFATSANANAAPAATTKLPGKVMFHRNPGSSPWCAGNMRSTARTHRTGWKDGRSENFSGTSEFHFN
jgi:hypothetical protein